MLAESRSSWNGFRPNSRFSDPNNHNWGGINPPRLAVNDHILAIHAMIAAIDAGKKVIEY